MTQFSIHKDDLTHTVRRASRIVRKGHIPELECLRFLVKDNVIQVYSTNLELYCRSSAKASTPIAGEFLLNSSALNSLIKSLQSDQVTFTVSDRVAVVESGRLKAQLPTMSAADFPEMRGESGLKEFPDAKPAIESVFKLADKNQAFETKSAINLHKKTWAYDGSACAIYDAAPEIFSSIPARFCAEIISSIGDHGRFFNSKESWRVEADGHVLSGPCLEQENPFLPDSLKTGVDAFCVESSQLIDAIQASSQNGLVLISGKNGILSFSIEGQGLKIDVLDIGESFADFTVCFTSKVLLPILQATTGSTINVSMIGAQACVSVAGDKLRSFAMMAYTHKDQVLIQEPNSKGQSHET